MLQCLSIQNIVLIDRLDIDFKTGLHALTGETGAGKSILLDSLYLALGARADTGLIRKGQDKARVTARFTLSENHPALKVLQDYDLELDEGDSNTLIIRRTLQGDGRSKAFVNDQPVSVAALKSLAPCLIEIHGQHDNRGLLNPSQHIEYLDIYMGEENRLRSLWDNWRQSMRAYEDLQNSIDCEVEHEEYLHSALKEIDELDPQPGEEKELIEIRDGLKHREQIITAYREAHDLISQAEQMSSQAGRILERNTDKAGQKMVDILSVIDTGIDQFREALADIQSAQADIDENEHSLESVDDRLFALRALARKHRCQIEELPDKREKIAADLDLIENREDKLKQFHASMEKARQVYLQEAEKQHEKRRKAAEKLDKSVQAELAPLKLDKAQFKTQVELLEENKWGPNGIDRVRFTISTNPGVEPGPLDKVASGGELARIMLAMKVVMADPLNAQYSPALIFDEVDSGVGGSTADAVGERLSRLAADKQIMVVTHSPQVAARADHHMIISKSEDESRKTLVTRIMVLDNQKERCEEIARMLAGAKITQEARAAASKLLSAA